MAGPREGDGAIVVAERRPWMRSSTDGRVRGMLAGGGEPELRVPERGRQHAQEELSHVVLVLLAHEQDAVLGQDLVGPEASAWRERRMEPAIGAAVDRRGVELEDAVHVLVRQIDVGASGGRNRDVGDVVPPSAERRIELDRLAAAS